MVHFCFIPHPAVARAHMDRTTQRRTPGVAEKMKAMPWPRCPRVGLDEIELRRIAKQRRLQLLHNCKLSLHTVVEEDEKDVEKRRN
ncbi:hypothetical protein GCK32_013791 [Trichostrongylus colubriformis]|uniref:Uncharacterized protein n=1 Tax=Trichostrongylus colubriformis TaxID=6319 RepID=A0AAN8F0S4_TRICO